MAFVYNKLEGKIIEVFGTREAYAEALGTSKTSVSKKLNNKVQFTPTEIMKSIDLLGIKHEDISVYFFTPEVQKPEQD